ncbi:MAG: alpha/beta hydrolase family protein [Lysobacterales bacterium]
MNIANVSDFSIKPGLATLLTVALTALALAEGPLAAHEPVEPGRHLIEVKSSVDGSFQPSYLILPPSFDPLAGEVPLVVSVHSWSHGLEQRQEAFEEETAKRGWLYLFPHFRGRNDHPEACGSELALRDVIDTLDWVIGHYPVDEDRVYLTGISGGGFMTLALAAHYPQRWTAASAWVPITDFRAWYDFHAGDTYGEMTRKCFGGDPSEDPAVAERMKLRSPVEWLEKAAELPLEISAGRFDGHNGAAIPVRHTLEAFNVMARAAGSDTVSEDEIAQLSRHEPRLEQPRDGDELFDAYFGRDIFLRREADKSRVTIFDGAHEGIAPAAMAWFEANTPKG